MGKIIFSKKGEAQTHRRSGHPGFEYLRYDLVPREQTNNAVLGLYELPPGMSNYPYHCHMKNEEVFYILSGTGTLRTPEGERPVGPGDAIYFPPEEGGAHKLTNSSETETLVYLDFDVSHDLDACLYPDSGKIGVWGKGINQLYQTKDQVDYYEGE